MSIHLFRTSCKFSPFPDQKFYGLLSPLALFFNTVRGLGMRDLSVITHRPGMVVVAFDRLKIMSHKRARFERFSDKYTLTLRERAAPTP